MNRPTIVCLCGSTRFPDAWKTAHREESLAGRIVLSVGVMIHAGDEPIRTDGPEKRLLDELHFRKIELADEILVLNVGGYIGYSTGREIAHAKSLGKRVRYLEAEPQEERPAPAERTLLAPLWAGDGPGQTVSGPAASLREAEPQEPNCPLKTGLRPCECDLPRCPVCNYTVHDARFEMDHGRCSGKIPAAAEPQEAGEGPDLPIPHYHYIYPGTSHGAPCYNTNCKMPEPAKEPLPTAADVARFREETERHGEAIRSELDKLKDRP